MAVGAVGAENPPFARVWTVAPRCMRKHPVFRKQGAVFVTYLRLSHAVDCFRLARCVIRNGQLGACFRPHAHMCMVAHARAWVHAHGLAHGLAHPVCAAGSPSCRSHPPTRLQMIVGQVYERAPGLLGAFLHLSLVVQFDSKFT